MTGTGGSIVLDVVSKQFGGSTVVRDVSLTIGPGEFFSLLGPSGCGKTTTLRMIGGFEQPSSGRILLDGDDLAAASPAERNMNMVFQSYALFPHLTVAENVAFGLRAARSPLRRRGPSKAEITERVSSTLTAMRVDALAERRPAQLSGGQQQRVALARALVNRPAALLLDEPLGALDLKLRRALQVELKAIHEQTGTTFVFVTHDQDEAMTMSDRIAIMRDGVVEQVASPRELYERPATPFVAGFVGVANLLTLRMDRRVDGVVIMDLGAAGERLCAAVPPTRETIMEVTIRPEYVRVAVEAEASDRGDRETFVRGTVVDLAYLGSRTEVTVELPTGERLVSHRLNDRPTAAVERGSAVVVTWEPEHAFRVGADAQAVAAADAHV
jgi:spermidine/putrescine transport system ATP-binding protein